MATYTTQTGDFDYLFNFTTLTGEHAWDAHLTYTDATSDLWGSPTLIQNLSGLSGISTALEYSAPWLFLGNPQSGIVEVYQSDRNNAGVPEGNFENLNRITGSGIEGVSAFGHSLAASGSIVAIGAPESLIGTVSGAGAVFCNVNYLTGGAGVTGTGGWAQLGYWTGTQLSGNFGSSLAVKTYKTTPLVGIGATGETAGSGAVHLYNGLNLAFVDTITPTGDDVEKFGRAQVFAPVNNLGYLGIATEVGGSGRVYVYKESRAGQNDYTFFQELSGESGHAGDAFGGAMRAVDSTIMIGSPGVGGSGAVYVYEFNTELGAFSQSQALVPTDAAPNQHFGKSLGFGTGIAAIASDLSSGNAYIYLNEGGHWTQTNTVSGDQTTVSGSFGGSASGSENIVVDGNRILIGTSGENDTYYFSTGAPVATTYTGVSFSGSGNKVYDADGNFIYGHAPNTMCSISGGVFNTGTYSIFVNDNLCRSQAPRTVGAGQTGQLNSWTVNGTGAFTYYLLQILA